MKFKLLTLTLAIGLVSFGSYIYSDELYRNVDMKYENQLSILFVILGIISIPTYFWYLNTREEKRGYFEKTLSILVFLFIVLPNILIALICILSIGSSDRAWFGLF